MKVEITIPRTELLSTKFPGWHEQEDWQKKFKKAEGVDLWVGIATGAASNKKVTFDGNMAHFKNGLVSDNCYLSSSENGVIEFNKIDESSVKVTIEGTFLTHTDSKAILKADKLYVSILGLNGPKRKDLGIQIAFTTDWDSAQIIPISKVTKL